MIFRRKTKELVAENDRLTALAESCEEVPCPNPGCEGKIGTQSRVAEAPDARTCWSCGMTVWFAPA